MSKLIGLADADGEKCYTELAPNTQTLPLSHNILNESDLNEALNESVSLGSDSMTFRILNISTSGLSLDGGAYLLISYVHNQNYYVQVAIKYGNPNAIIKVRTAWNGTPKSWHTVAYSD